MTDTDFDGFIDRLVVLAEIFNAPLSTAAQLLYFEALKDLPVDAVHQALTTCLRSCTFMPKPSEIRQHVSGDLETATEAAWLDYKQLARTVGGYRSPLIADAALADALVAIFGSWEAACWTELSPEMWAAKRKEFGRVYRVMRERGGTEPRVLPGYCDRMNNTTLDGVRARTLPSTFDARAVVGPAMTDGDATS